MPASDAKVGETKNESEGPSSTELAPGEIAVSHPFFGSAQQHKLDHWDMAFGADVDMLRTLIEIDLAFGEPSEGYRAYEANSGGQSPNLEGTSGKAESFVGTIRKTLAGELRWYRARSCWRD